MKRTLLLTLIASISFCTAALGQPDFAQFIPSNEGFKFTLQKEVTNSGQAAENLPITPAVLDEAGFQSLSLWNVDGEGFNSLTLEVVETADSVGTYELFNLLRARSADSGGRSLSLPVGNRVSGNEGLFWKGKFLFHVHTSADSIPEQPFVRLVTSLAESIPMENLLPVSISHLPGEGLVNDSVRFYLGAASLKENERFPEPLLKEIGLADRIEIAYGRYEPGGDALFVIGYPTVALARDYLERMQNSLQAFFSKEGIYMKRSGILIGLFVGPEDRAVKVLSQLNYAPSVQWVQDEKPKDQRQETITFLGLVTKAILGTGTLILIIIGVGIVAGFIRYSIVRRNPVLLRRDDMIRLNLED
jgi:hypothetical protein